MLGSQSLESRVVTGKVLIAERLGLLHPYLPDRSRLARGVIGGGTARLAAFCFLISIIFLFSYFYYKGGCQVLFGILKNGVAISGSKLALEAIVEFPSFRTVT